MRIHDLINNTDETIQVGDHFGIELGNDLIIESIVVDFYQDGVVIQGDDTMLAYLNTSEVQDNRKFSEMELAIMEGGHSIEEAEYHGKNVPLGKPFLTPDGPKKRSVYVKNPKGNIVKVNFGQKGVKIKKSNPNRRRSFRARHNCDNPGPRWKARYWSCKSW